MHRNKGLWSMLDNYQNSAAGKIETQEDLDYFKDAVITHAAIYKTYLNTLTLELVTQYNDKTTMLPEYFSF